MTAVADTADLDQLYGSELAEIVSLTCPCCATSLGAHSLIEAFRCGQKLAPEPKRRGSPPNTEGCQSRLYGRWGVHAKCFLPEGHDGDEHRNGYRRWSTGDSLATAARWRT